MTNNAMTQREKVFVVGASGHAKVIIDILERQGKHEIAFLIDDDPMLKGKDVYGYRVLGDRLELLSCHSAYPGIRGIVAIGSNRVRKTVACWLKEGGFELVSAIHPSAQLGRGVTIGDGSVVMACAVINSDTVIGTNVIINTGATVDHDCTIGNYAHIAPGVTLCGTVTIGDGSFIGAGATVIPNITIGRNVMVGGGATVVDRIPDGVTVVGTPARAIKNKGMS
jgi:sugar O-acyltransferase (sialic acid O-acetyltransferase NeuD family)